MTDGQLLARRDDHGYFGQGRVDVTQSSNAEVAGRDTFETSLVENLASPQHQPPSTTTSIALAEQYAILD